MRSMSPQHLCILIALNGCATFEQSQLMGGDGCAAVTGGGGQAEASGAPTGGASGADPTGGTAAVPAGESGNGGAASGGTSAGGTANSAGGAGMVAGGAGVIGNGAGGTTGTGGVPAGGAPAGGAPAAGASAAGGSSINPCDRANWTATASESSLMMPNLYDPPSYAIDGMAGTRWSSGLPPKGGEWFMVDLGAKAAHLTKVVLDTTNSTGDIPPAYKLELSVDNSNFSQVATGMGADLTTITFADTAARYIKVTQTQTSTATQGHWWSIHELTVTCTP